WLGRSTALATLTSPNATHPATIARHPAPRCPPVLGYRGKDMSMNKQRNKSRTGPEQVLQPQRTVLPREHPLVPSRPWRGCDAAIAPSARSWAPGHQRVVISYHVILPRGDGKEQPRRCRDHLSVRDPRVANSPDEQAMEQVTNK